MKKLIVLVAILAFASLAFGQARTAMDTRLGKHDVYLDATQSDRGGCQSCHVPHGATVEEYLWKYTLPTNIIGNEKDANGATAPITVDANSFHTLACMSCHDGVTASDVVAGNFTANDPAMISKDTEGLMNDHPVHQQYKLHSANLPTMKYVRFYADGVTQQKDANGVLVGVAGNSMGYAECGSCHDPHKGDPAKSYKFLRGPSSSYTDPAGQTYTAPSAQWARLGLCRDCHSSR